MATQATNSPNAFNQGVIKGMMDLRVNNTVISAQIHSSSAGNLQPGQAVKIVDEAGGLPKIVEVASATDDVFGFIVYDAKRQFKKVGDAVEIAVWRGNVMYMEAAGPVSRGKKVAVDASPLTSLRVSQSGAGAYAIGQAIDKAVAAGDLIRVHIDLPGSLGN